MTPTIKPKRNMTIHKDNTVSYWNIYLQQWQRTTFFALVDKRDVFASFSQQERDAINRARNRALA